MAAPGERQHKHRHRRPRLLTYDVAAVPEGGAAVYAQLSAVGLSYWKEPAGHLFHIAALKQAGLFGEPARRGPALAAAAALPSAACMRRRRLLLRSLAAFPLASCLLQRSPRSLRRRRACPARASAAKTPPPTLRRSRTTGRPGEALCLHAMCTCWCVVWRGLAWAKNGRGRWRRRAGQTHPAAAPPRPQRPVEGQGQEEAEAAGAGGRPVRAAGPAARGGRPTLTVVCAAPRRGQPRCLSLQPP